MNESIAQSASAGPRRGEFFWLLVRRDLKTRYAGSTMGMLWNIIHPIVMILIYIMIFSTLMGGRGEALGGGARGYAIHICAGILVWLVFSETLSRTVATLVENANLLQKVAFPPLVLHASIMFNVLVTYGAGLIALWLLLAATGPVPPASAFAAFGVMILAGLAAAGIGAVLSALNVFFRDTAQIVLVMLQLGFWMNPIVYPKSQLESTPLGDVTGWISLNPMEHFVSLGQQLFADPTAEPARAAWAVAILFPIISVAVGVWIFNRLLPDVRDGL